MKFKNKILKPFKRKLRLPLIIPVLASFTLASLSPAAISHEHKMHAKSNTQKENHANAKPLVYSPSPIVIDAKDDEAIWSTLAWRPLDQLLIGENLSKDDFSGKYKLTWREDALYLLLEFKDDVLIDTHPDPTVQYWEDDCVEVFVDQDNSGGDHLSNYNAFAYHVGLDRVVSDIGPVAENSEAIAQTYNDHVNSAWTRRADNGHLIWELQIYTYDDGFMPSKQNYQASPLKEGQELGFMLAYCDADDASGRQHFIGSYPIEGINGDKNLGYKTADVFESMYLVK